MPGTRHVWLVRHGERVDNVNPEWRKDAPRGAWDDPPLTDRGHQQAREVGMRLSRERIDCVFTSPFTRCLQTTSDLIEEYYKNAAADAPRPKIFVESGFCESLSACQSPPGHLTMDEIKKQFPLVDPSYSTFLTKLPKEKTGRCCLPRIQSTLEHVLQKYPGNVLIVSHGSPIAACHLVLSTKYKYVGQCTISQYSMLERVEENNNELREDCENDTTACNGNATRALNTSNKETGITLEDFQLSTLHKRFKFACILAGDTAHLTDKTNLRDVCRE